MSVIGRITVWLIPSILLWGGCAAPAVVNPAAEIDSILATGEQQSTPGVSQMVKSEAAMIRGLAVEKGYGEAAATKFEQSVLNAAPSDRQFLTRLFYAQLNKMDGGPAGDQQADPVRPVSSPPFDSPYRVSPAVGSRKITDASPDARHASLDRPPWPEEPSRTRRRESLAPTTAEYEEAEVNRFASQSRHFASAREPELSPLRRARTSGLSDISTGAERGANRARSSSVLPDKGRTEPRSHSDRGFADTRAAAPSDADVSWQRQLRLTISRLRRELAENDELDSLDESRSRACLSLLHLAAEHPEGAMESLEGLDEQQREFWKQTIWGLDILLDSDELPKMRHRVESAAEHLNSGLIALEATGPLRVNNLAFVSAVRGFGAYDEISPHTFRPGDQALLYVEIDNFTAELVDESERTSTTTKRRHGASQSPMYETEISGRYEILDQRQQLVGAPRKLPIIVDSCRQQRRDFFIPYDFSVPRDLSPGYYTVELTIKDIKGDKLGSASIDMKVR